MTGDMEGKPSRPLEVGHGCETGIESLASSGLPLMSGTFGRYLLSTRTKEKRLFSPRNNSKTLDNNGFIFQLQDNYEAQSKEVLLTFC